MNRSTLTFIFFFSLYLNVYGQDMIGVLDYMNVSNEKEYLEVEKKWKKIHETRMQAGQIIGWVVYKIMYKTAEDPYNFVTVSFYDDFLKLNKAIPDHIYKAAYPNKTEDEWETFQKQTSNSRKVVNSAIFQQKLASSKSLNPVANIFVVNELIVKQSESKEYLRLKEEIYKPLHEEAILNNKRATWSLWAKWPGDTGDFQYISADGYISMDQIEEVNYLEYFKKIHPDKDIDQISDKTKELSTLVNSELWKVIYRVIKKEE